MNDGFKRNVNVEIFLSNWTRNDISITHEDSLKNN